MKFEALTDGNQESETYPRADELFELSGAYDNYETNYLRQASLLPSYSRRQTQYVYHSPSHIPRQKLLNS